ncbi:MAG: hypothetical protein ABIT38_24545 [Gemmatimonadaceae bacterium]
MPPVAVPFVVLVRRVIVLCAAVSTVGASEVGAQQRDTITIEQRVLVTGDLTPTDARRRAIEEGLAEAVRRLAGVRVQSNALSVLDERGSAIRGGWSSVVQLDASARAVDYRVVEDEWVPVRHPELGTQLYYRAKLLVSVEHETGAPDPSFTAEASVDAARYTARSADPASNDEIRGTVRVSQSAFLTVFVVTDDSAERVIPNEYVRELRGAASVGVEIPPPDWRARGVRLRASLAPGRAHSRSLLMVVATLESVPPPVAFTLSVLDVQRWLVRIPASRRALAFAPFETVR